MTSRISLIIALALAACSTAEPDHPDAVVVTTIPSKIGGEYAVSTTFDFATLPAPATALLALFDTATDTPDDPARYLIDRMVAALPAGPTKVIGLALSAYVAPYVQLKIDRIAPKFTPGIRALSRGLTQLGHRMTVEERFVIASAGTTTRSITALRLGTTPVAFADGPEHATTQATIDFDGALRLAPHDVALPYGEILALAMDRAVIPSIDLGAHDLADLLRDLVDCAQLGAAFSEAAGFGSPALYEAACAGAMLGLASEVYTRMRAIDAAPFTLHLTGTALGLDWNGDEAMDEIREGAWTGTASYDGVSGPVGVATFAGRKPD